MRNREYAKNDRESFIIRNNQYTLIDNTTFSVNISHSLLPDYVLNFTCAIYDFGIVRCSIDDYGPYKRFKISNFGPVVVDSQASKRTLTLSSQPNKIIISTQQPIYESLPPNSRNKVLANSTHSYSLEVSMDPFKVSYLVDGEAKAIVNENQYLNYEIHRTIEQQQNIIHTAQFPDATKYEEDINNLYFDSFGSANRSIPYGPSSVALDFSFPNSQNLYGLPLHTTSYTLEETINDEPYRLFNSDVYGYPLDSKGAIYGAIPYVLSRSEKDYVEMLWLNGADTWIDIRNDPHKNAHWISEAGTIEFFLFAASTPDAIIFKLHVIIGRAPIPVYAMLGYHQSRYSYNDEKDVREVDEGFDSRQIPYESIWLDIDHTVERKYFTWDKSKYPDPLALQELYKNKSRFVVTIVDPHLSDDKGYFVYSQALQRTDISLFVLNKDKDTYHGKCWPGSSVYIDYLNSQAREFWIDLIVNYPDTSDNHFIWNDMNEPSVFESIEMTMPKDCLYFL
eukprot:TRINITY_DN4212_c0_g2_i1.p1 TRINITY_DN4212_c0_g2~~TRINITY_DN4212_c0_g2_i1.p1  ORF type:complete len:507 (-),score=103.35 TRINITY_DN4212_c0_g2_i1:1259-2779(-)